MWSSKGNWVESAEMTVSLQSHGVGPAVIFLHGVGSGKEGWDHQIDTVLQAGWRFVAIDAPGFG